MYLMIYSQKEGKHITLQNTHNRVRIKLMCEYFVM